MTPQDIDKVMQIEQKCFTLPWSRESYLGELKNSFAIYLVCDFEGEIAGYGGIWVVFEEAHITNVAVDPDFQQSGMGTALMQELEQAARNKKANRILLEVRPSNEAALTMYGKLDYFPSGLRRGYYSDNGEDAIIMTKLLF
jgi:ribosomal-protein-alanine N-acetyltransferase